jgi:hypothetical protein
MAKTKRCRNGKMKKYNKTRKYVKGGGNNKRKQISLQLIDPKEFKSKLEVSLYPIINTLNGISQENDFLNEKLEELFKHLKEGIFDINEIKKTGKDWCTIHEDTLREYKEFKNMLVDKQSHNPSLVSLIDEIHNRLNEFENGRNEYKDGYCESDGPLPPTPDVRPFRAVRPRASTPQEAAPPPPPRRGKGSGSYKRLGPNRMTRQMSLRKPSTLKSLKTVSTDPYQYPTNIKHLLKNAPYENVSPFRKSSSSKGYNPFFDPKFKN